jgi:glycosyltransferase involved in cell wall biosynthesis
MSRQLPARALFWGAVGTVAYAYVGFPLLCAARAALAPRPVRRDAAHTPSVSLIIAAHNEAGVIAAKLANSRALEYPAELLEIVVASDGSDDGTAALAAACGGPNLVVLELPRQGKNRTLNSAVAAARNELLVFSDADSALEPQALRRLAAAFADPAVGGVAGDYRYRRGSSVGGETAYWSLDRALKGWQSRAGSITSATGQLYAIRRALFQPVPDGVTDDFFISVQVPLAGRRLLFEPAAVATGPQAATARAEFRRKVRVASAGLRGVWMARRGLDPRSHGAFALQLLSHKLLRRLAAIPLLLLSLVAPLLWRRGPIYRLAAAGLWAIHGLGLLGYLLRDSRLGKRKLLSLPFFFELVNGAVLVALAELARGARHDTWVPERHPGAARVEMARLDQDRGHVAADDRVSSARAEISRATDSAWSCGKD